MLPSVLQRRQYFVTLVANVVLMGLGLVSSLIVARYLGPGGRGQLAAVQLWPVLLATFGSLGLSEALVFQTAKQPLESRQYVGSAVLFLIPVSVLLMILGYGILPLVLSAQDSQVLASAREYLWLIPLWIFVNVVPASLQGMSGFFAWNIWRVCLGFVWTGTILLAVFRGEASPGAIANNYLLALLILAIPSCFAVYLRLEGRWSVGWRRIKQLLGFGFPSALSGMPQLLNMRLDQVVLGAFMPAHLLGLYVVAVGWSNMSQPILHAFAKILFPGLAGMPRLEDRHRTLAAALRSGAFVSTLLTVVVFCVTPFLFTWVFGSSFQAAVPAALLLVLAAGVSAWNVLAEEGFRGLGEPRVVLWAEVAGLIGTAFGLMLLLPFGIVGVAASSLLSSCVMFAFLVSRASHRTSVAWLGLVIPDASDFRRDFLGARWPWISAPFASKVRRNRIAPGAVE